MAPLAQRPWYTIEPHVVWVHLQPRVDVPMFVYGRFVHEAGWLIQGSLDLIVPRADVTVVCFAVYLHPMVRSQGNNKCLIDRSNP